MNYGQKYKDALKRASKLRVQNPFDTVGQMVEHIFPELKESEDERIRKAIHIYLDWLDGRKDYAPKGSYSIKDMIDWLEKQGEQPTDKIEPTPAWSEEDEEMLKWLCRIIHSQRLRKEITLKEESELGEWMDKWLNHNPQTKQGKQLNSDKVIEWLKITIKERAENYGVYKETRLILPYSSTEELINDFKEDFGL